MKLFKFIEKYIRKKRNKFFKELFSFNFWKKIHLEAMSDDILYATKQLKDHKLTFIPKEWIGRSIYTKGHYKKDIFEKIILLLKKHKLINNKKDVVELGSNIGTHTIYMHLSNCFEHIYCVEADPKNIKLLNTNLAQNNFIENSTVISKAIHDFDGNTKLFRSPNEFNLGAQSLLDIGKFHKSIDIECNTLNSILINNKIDKHKIGFFWIDLEGIEFNIIKQINSVIDNSIPILTEFSPIIYGKKKTNEFKRYIEKKYSYCYLIRSHEEKFIKFCDNERLELNFDQADLLLFN